MQHNLPEQLFDADIQIHQDETSGQLLVVKRMKLEEDVEEFVTNEVAIARVLTSQPHPNIVTFKESYVTESECLLVMEHCSGGDLFTFNEQVHKFHIPQPVIQRLMSEIVNGLTHLHSLGIAHRDIALENILLDEHLHSRLCDFGLAAQNASVFHDRVGRPFYMAPEVYNDSLGPYDGFKADIWSLGVLLFILVTGNPPFQFASVQDPRFQLVQRRSVRQLIELYETEVPEVVIDLLEKILICSPNQRLSIEEVAAHPYFQQPQPLLNPSSWRLLFQSNVPCSSCPSIMHIGHRKLICQSCYQIMCSSCRKRHLCRFRS